MNQQKYIFLFLWITFLSNVLIFTLIIILSLPAINGFNMDLETSRLFKVYLPVVALYLGPITAYVIRQKNSLTLKKKEVNLTYVFFTSTIVFIHLSSITCFLLLTAYSQISFDNLIILTGIIEVAFGTYVNLIIADMFKKKKEVPTKTGN